MTTKCLNPNTAWVCGVIRCKSDNVLSQHLVFSAREAEEYFTRIYGTALALKMMQRNEISVPCGKCMACQIRKRKDWTTRLSHESSCYGDNCCFVTLTYNDDNLPVTDYNSLASSSTDSPKLFDRGFGSLPLPTLFVSDVQKFIKRLRRHLEYSPKSATKRQGRDYCSTPIRYYAVGEYGGKFGRPHYHLLIFGWSPSDMTFHCERNGHIIYRSAQIEKLWKFGYSTVEPVQGGVARYCSRYVTKKFARLESDDPFKSAQVPEFFLQSVRHGGIGSTWFDKHYATMMERGFATIKSGTNFVKVPIPAYYWQRCRKRDIALWLRLRDERIQFARTHVPSAQSFDDLVRSCDCYRVNELRLQQYELF